MIGPYDTPFAFRMALEERLGLTRHPGILRRPTLCEIYQFLPWLFSQLYPLFDVQASILYVLPAFPPV